MLAIFETNKTLIVIIEHKNCADDIAAFLLYCRVQYITIVIESSEANPDYSSVANGVGSPHWFVTVAMPI